MANPGYVLQTAPFRVPTTDGKRIEEHFGLASTGTNAFSVAYMVAPPQWSEPFQQPEFDEVTLVLEGRKLVEVDAGDGRVEKLVLVSGQSVLVRAGTRVRYANPFDEPTAYVSVCVPAFQPATVHRDPA